MNESIMYSEIYSILNFLGADYINKLPKELYEYIYSKKNKEYIRKIDGYKSVEEQNFMDKTIEFIAFLNLEYWADEDEKKKLISMYTENDKKYEDELRKKYMPNGLYDPFSKTAGQKNKENDEVLEKYSSNENLNNENTSNSMAIVSVNQNNNIFRKIINLVKKIFRK